MSSYSAARAQLKQLLKALRRHIRQAVASQSSEELRTRVILLLLDQMRPIGYYELGRQVLAEYSRKVGIGRTRVASDPGQPSLGDSKGIGEKGLQRHSVPPGYPEWADREDDDPFEFAYA